MSLFCEKKDIILVVVDRFSKLAKFGTTKTTTTIVETTTLFFDMWVKTSWHAQGHCKRSKCQVHLQI
jgi:hypothetical protein